MRWSPRALATAAVVVASTAAVSCSSGSSDSFLTWDQMNAEYRTTVASFPFSLPAGVEFPAAAPKPSTDQQSLYEPGAGAMQAYIYAQCAQEHVALQTQTSDPRASAAALDAIEEIDNSPVYQQHYVDPDGVWKAILGKARLGDYSTLQEWYTNDCTGGWADGTTG